MECQKMSNSKTYLARFDQILNEMASKMLSANITDSITINFIQCMIPHHQAAIYMCENLLRYTNYRPLQEIAHNIIEMQTRGIKQMREIASTTKGYKNSKQDVSCYMKRYYEITKSMICRMKNSLRSANINLNFVSEMIPHHEGAIAMCENLLDYCIDPRLVNVARTIIQEQSQGVRELKNIRAELCSN